MYLTKIISNNFRNLVNLNLSFNKQINVFVGENGQGKTNLLEGIYFMSLTKSFKTNKAVEMITFNQNEFFLRANLYKKEYPYQIDISLNKNKKNISINDNNESKFKDVIGLLNVVLFVPEDLQLLKGNPALRRKLLDIELSKLYPKYLFNLSSYYHVLKQRNSYLKSEKIDELVLDSLDIQLAKYGVILTEYRRNFIKELEKLVNDFYQIISESQEIVTLRYLSLVKNDENLYYEDLKNGLQRDLLLQQTNLGIHRDDFQININDRNAGIFASQGEQRTIILAIKLALVEYIYQIIHDYPILLLDDVMSELDSKRQANLIKYLNDNIVQTFITTTNVSALEKEIIKKAKLFSINDGVVREAEH